MITNLSNRLRLGAVSFVALAAFTLLPYSSALAQSGARQSPIDVRAEDVTHAHLAKLKFAYGNHVALSVLNTGSPDENATVRAEVPADAGQLTIDGVTYTLLQFHWHTPSEHRVDGEEFPMEMHFVHKAADGTLVVVGVLIREGKENAELAKVFSQLPQAPQSRVAVADVNLRRLLPQVLNGHLRSFRYDGSLTTPPFTEGVKWNVLAKPIEMSAAQIDAFRALFPEHNSRECQPLNGRTVTTDVREH